MENSSELSKHKKFRKILRDLTEFLLHEIHDDKIDWAEENADNQFFYKVDIEFRKTHSSPNETTLCAEEILGSDTVESPVSYSIAIAWLMRYYGGVTPASATQIRYDVQKIGYNESEAIIFATIICQMTFEHSIIKMKEAN